MSFLKTANRYYLKRIGHSRVQDLRQPDREVPVDYVDVWAPRQLELRGAALELQTATDPEILLEGPAGTGKTVGALYKGYTLCYKHAGARVLILRKVRATIANSLLPSLEARVMRPDCPESGRVKLENRKAYHFSNGSTMVIGGMDNPEKLLSTEWDWIYVGEGLELAEDEYETLVTRLRGMATPYTQIVLDCNPGHPRHWANLRAGVPGRKAVMRRMRSKHEDNPRWHDGTGWTKEWQAYFDKLNRSSGVRRRRFLEGAWAGQEGIIYGEAVHDTHWLPEGTQLPYSWRRIWVLDFGFTNPAVWWQIAIDEDGRMYRELELYHTGLLVSDMAKMIRAATEGKYPEPEAIICDHDAEARATLEQALRLSTVPAYKAVDRGIDAVKARLRVAPDGRPRLMFVENSLIHEPDPELAEDDRRPPVCSDDEIAVYEWDAKAAARGVEQPKKRHDHGMDVMRYGVAYVDGLSDGAAIGWDVETAAVTLRRHSYF